MSSNMSSKFLLVASSTLALMGGALNCELAIAQTKSPEKSQITRPRVTFFEQEQKFGNEDFLQSALSGTTQAIADPAKLRPNGFSNFSANLIVSPNVAGSLITGPLNSVESSLTNAQFSSAIGNIQFNSLTPSSNPQIGTVSITGTLNGQNVTGTYNYNAGYSRNNSNSLSSGVILLVNPNNPSQSISIQAPPQPFGGGNAAINGPASLSIGLPKDR